MFILLFKLNITRITIIIIIFTRLNVDLLVTPTPWSIASATFVVFLKYVVRVCGSGPNPSPKCNGLWAILAIRMCMDPHFKNRPEIVDHLGNFGILFSTYYALGHTYCNLPYYLGWII